MSLRHHQTLQGLSHRQNRSRAQSGINWLRPEKSLWRPGWQDCSNHKIEESTTDRHNYDFHSGETSEYNRDFFFSTLQCLGIDTLGRLRLFDSLLCLLDSDPCHMVSVALFLQSGGETEDRQQQKPGWQELLQRTRRGQRAQQFQRTRKLLLLLIFWPTSWCFERFHRERVTIPTEHVTPFDYVDSWIFCWTHHSIWLTGCPWFFYIRPNGMALEMGVQVADMIVVT